MATDSTEQTRQKRARLEALFHTHELISREMESYKLMREEPVGDDEFSEGHMNGLKEANNRVEELVSEMVFNE